MKRSKLPVWLVLAVAVAALAVSCGDGFDDAGRYLNSKLGFSFIPPKGWTWHEGKTGECDYVAGAYQDNVYVYACVGEGRADVLSSSSDDENCASLVKYVQGKFHGRRVECRTSHIQRAKAYNAMFYREVRFDGRDQVQIVNLTGIAHKGRLLTMLATATGPGADGAKSVFNAHLDELTTSAGSFWLH